METKLVRIAEISATSKHPIFTSVYHLINEDMLKQCHKELDGNKAVGIDKVTKDEYGKNLDRNIKELVQRLKNKSFKPLPSLIAIKKLSEKYNLNFQVEIATIIMDYARGNMSIRPKMSYRLFNISKQYFSKAKSENIRRFVICQIDFDYSGAL
jgi:hypothetical protein